MSTTSEKEQFQVARAWYKSRINALSRRQKALKRLRKTSISAEEKKALIEETQISTGWAYETIEQVASWQVHVGAVAVTALLNWYAEVRSRKFRNAIREGFDHHYEKAMKAICEEVAALVGK